MAITYPLSLPGTGEHSKSVFTGKSVVAVSASPFTGAQQVQASQGQWWEAALEFPVMSRADHEQWAAFLLKLNGKEGTFYMGDPDGSTPRGSAATTPGSPQVNGASQTGNDIVIGGAPTSATDYLMAGDYVQFGAGSARKLYKILDDVTTDSGGGATITLWPEVKSAWANGTTVTVSNAMGVFRMQANTFSRESDRGLSYHFGFACMEVL